MTFQQKLDSIISKNNSLLCIGLDPDIKKLPQGRGQYEFNKTIIDTTHDLVCAYKPNSAFYEARGADGISELKMTCDYLHNNYKDIPIILDAKRGDIGSTNEGYAIFAYDYLGVDAITLQPYVGSEALVPFLNKKEKFSFILCRTTNPGAGEFQDLRVAKTPLYQVVAKRASAWGNCGLVVGATYPDELRMVRQLVPNTLFLVPGTGAQGGDLEMSMKNGQMVMGDGLIISTSRSIIFADNPRDEARKFRDAINKLRGTL